MNFKRLGIFFALLAGVLVDLNRYVMYPIPASLTAKWFVFGLIEFCVYGALAALLYPIKDNAKRSNSDATHRLQHHRGYL